METNEFVRLMVLNEICDDYENVDQIIFPHVSSECAKRGIHIERRDIVGALGELVEGGLAKAYLLSTRGPATEITGMPNLDTVEEYFETYFCITPEGMDVHMSGPEDLEIDS